MIGINGNCTYGGWLTMYEDLPLELQLELADQILGGLPLFTLFLMAEENAEKRSAWEDGWR